MFNRVKFYRRTRNRLLLAKEHVFVVGNKYLLEFEIDQLPKYFNPNSRVHWSKKYRESKLFLNLVWVKVLEHGAPVHPIKLAKLTLTRCSATAPDFDNLVSSFKAVTDALVKCKVLLDDKIENIQEQQYKIEKAPKGKGKIKIRVEEV